MTEERSVSVKTRVLDSWPIIEWLAGRSTRTDLENLFEQAETGTARLYMSGINAGEVYYVLRKNQGERLASIWRETSLTLPVTIEVPSQEDIWSAALLKGTFPISYADGFAAALAQKYRCPLVTGDPEFRLVEGLQVDWLGQQ
jgi:predicted nucleic acid-binding protein